MDGVDERGGFGDGADDDGQGVACVVSHGFETGRGRAIVAWVVVRGLVGDAAVMALKVMVQLARLARWFGAL